MQILNLNQLLKLKPLILSKKHKDKFCTQNSRADARNSNGFNKLESFTTFHEMWYFHNFKVET